MDNEKSIRYADINCNETAVKPSGKNFLFYFNQSSSLSSSMETR